jgi:calcium permeable stress-gated cation channel
MLLAGSVLAALTQILKNPISIFSLLAKSLPTVATFFINYFLTLLLSGIPLNMLRIAPWLIYKLYRMCFNSRKLTARTLLEGPLSPYAVDFSLVIPSVLYPVCISLTYMVIAPILFALAGLYFGALYITWKYQFLFIIVQPFETGGKYWYKMFNFTMTGLLASNITMIGYMALKQGAAQTALLLPLPIVTYYVWGRCQANFQSFSSNMAHSLAVEKDLSEEGGNDFNPDFYQPPALCLPDAVAEPYRVEGADLLDSNGYLNPAYAIVSMTKGAAISLQQACQSPEDGEPVPTNDVPDMNYSFKPIRVQPI